MSNQIKRLVRAVCLLACGAVVLICVGHKFPWNMEKDLPDGVPLGQTVQQAICAEDNPAMAVFSLVGGMSLEALQDVPPDFCEHVCDPVSVAATEAYMNGSVVGMVSDRPVSAVEDSLRAELAANGWSRVVSGGKNTRGQAYITQNGPYCWCYVLCQEVADATSVVIVVQRADERKDVR